MRYVGPFHRFDHHVVLTGGDRGLMYLARDFGTAAAEVFGDEGRKGTAVVCPGSWAAWVAPSAPFRVQDITGPGVMGIGATAELGSDVDRQVSQAWARAIYEDRASGEEVGGILYRARHDYGIALAVWERAPRFVVRRDARGDAVDRPLRDPAVWLQLVVELAERSITPKPVAASECARCRAGY